MSAHDAWLASVCSTEVRRFNLHTPWRWREWMVASNGHVLLLCRAIDGDPTGSRALDVGALVEPVPSPALHTTVAALREWAGPYEETCPACGGVERVRCGQCHGARVQDVGYEDTTDRLGTILGRALNLRLLAFALRHAPDGDVALGAHENPVLPLHIDGGSWRLLVMPIRPDNEADRARENQFVAPATEASA